MPRSRLLAATALTFTVATAALTGARSGDAASTKRVVTDCCELRVPAAMQVSTNGNEAQGRWGDLNIQVRASEASSAADAVDRVVADNGFGRATYRTSSSQWAVKSGYYEGEGIYYVRAEFDRGCGLSGTLVITYPKANRGRYDASIATMSKSFRSDLCG